MQKIVNLIAIASGVVSLAVVGSGLYVYVQRDQLIDSVKQQVIQGGGGALGGSLGGGLGGGITPTLPQGATDLSADDNLAGGGGLASPSTGLPTF